jgi:hypothetical protein
MNIPILPHLPLSFEKFIIPYNNISIILIREFF